MTDILFQLPTNPVAPKTTISDLTTLIYGPTKSGKSTFCSHSDGAIFFATEPGLNSLNVFQVGIDDWKTLKMASAAIAKGEHKFKTVVIDTIDNAYKMCSEYACAKAGIQHESDLPFGKGFSATNNEFQRVINRLARLPYGLIMISHSCEKEMETRTGKLTRTVPTMPEGARKFIVGLADLVLFADLEKDKSGTWQRVLRTKPNPNYDAGDRTGLLPETLPLDYNLMEEELKKGSKKNVR